MGKIGNDVLSKNPRVKKIILDKSLAYKTYLKLFEGIDLNDYLTKDWKVYVAREVDLGNKNFKADEIVFKYTGESTSRNGDYPGDYPVTVRIIKDFPYVEKFPSYMPGKQYGHPSPFAVYIRWKNFGIKFFLRRSSLRRALSAAKLFMEKWKDSTTKELVIEDYRKIEKEEGRT
jgi:hypothetical protein